MARRFFFSFFKQLDLPILKQRPQVASMGVAASYFIKLKLKHFAKAKGHCLKVGNRWSSLERDDYLIGMAQFISSH